MFGFLYYFHFLHCILFFALYFSFLHCISQFWHCELTEYRFCFFFIDEEV
jgi:hypothetical protein